MRLIKITPTVKLRVKKMILGLFDEYNYVRVRKTGLISLKRRWWSLKRTRVSLTDLIIGEIPKRIAKQAKALGKGDEYLALFNINIASVIHISTYSEEFCVVDYVWNKYIDLCLEVPVVGFLSEETDIHLPESRERIPLDFIENTYWYGIIRSLQLRKLSYQDPSVASQVSEIKSEYL
jgi:hypothetical protein